MTEPDNFKIPPTPDHTGPGEGSTEDRITSLESELKDAQDRVLRAVADYQNFARRARQDIAQARQQQLLDAARTLLPVLDHFDRALQIDRKTITLEGLLTGVEMVHGELLKALNSLGITRVEAKTGEPFDPHKHEAMLRQPVAGLAPNHVAQQLEVGYAIGELIVRPAKVSVTE